METPTPETNLALTDVAKPVNYFADSTTFDHVQRVAKMFASSDLIPVKYKDKPANCIIAIEIAARIGASPLLVMQNLDIIQGKPAWSSTFLIATINSCGKFSPLRYEEDEKDGGRTRAWAYDLKNNEKLCGPWVSMEMAKAEGWVARNGSKWKNMAELMRRYRAATFFSRQFAPEVSMGMHTVEEVIDITPMQAPSNEEKESARLMGLIDAATTIDELKAYQAYPKTDAERARYYEKMRTFTDKPTSEKKPAAGKAGKNNELPL